MATATENQEPWFLRYKTPILFPTHEGFDLSMPQSKFDELIKEIINTKDDEVDQVNENPDAEEAKEKDNDDSFTLVSEATTTKNLRGHLDHLEMSETDESTAANSDNDGDQPLPSEDGLDASLMMRTTNNDLAYRTTKSPLVDLFYELEKVVSAPQAHNLLNAAWAEDPLATLKIIFNARSIHLGKASRDVFYRTAGWLAINHPLTLIANLRWICRPVIEKKKDEKKEEDEMDKDTVMVDLKPDEKNPDDITRFDVRNGVSHGYWKDLLNLLVIAVEDKLDTLVTPRDVLYVEKGNSSLPAKRKRKYAPTQDEARTLRHETRNKRHDQAIEAFNKNPVYRALYLTITRLFAEQLTHDLSLLHSKDPKAKRAISLCAKWAPSHDRFHDKHTTIVSSIAESMYPTLGCGATETMDRELYLRHARERYRQDTAALRAHLDIVERHLAAKTYSEIKYDRVPSLAMNAYTKTFATRDPERFEEYIEGVAKGDKRISGAVLLPSTLIHQALGALPASYIPSRKTKITAKAKVKAKVEEKIKEMTAKVVDGQWKTLVQRIKDSGTLESSIAVCDVSGSMTWHVFHDGTVPMDSSIGLSLLLAEVTAPPFGGHFITFSGKPQLQSIDLSASLYEKVHSMRTADWGMNTDFVAVFKDLLLPLAKKNKLTREAMVKRVFVFSDMQFDQAARPESSGGQEHLSRSSMDHVRGLYAEAGYDVPELVFWNLAGGSQDPASPRQDADTTAPKPVLADETGTALVSGYSQGMLKVFLENGSFDYDEGDDDDDEKKVKTTEDGDAVLVDSAKKAKNDPLGVVRKAIGHKAYDPFEVLD